jgi:hypothetical protein
MNLDLGTMKAGKQNCEYKLIYQCIGRPPKPDFSPVHGGGYEPDFVQSQEKQHPGNLQIQNY